MKNHSEINQTDIFQSVKSEAIGELTPEILQTGYDLIVESEILKDIPIFGIGFKSYSLYNKITESFFTRKLLVFLYQLKSISLLQRKKFIAEIESKNKTKKAGEQLLITLTRLNDIEKSTIIGKLFKYTILGKIVLDDFTRLSHIIDNSYIEDIKLLKNNEQLENMSEDIKSNLHQVGLLTLSIKDNRTEIFQFELTKKNVLMQPKFEYQTNQYSKILIKYGFAKSKITESK